MTLNGKWRVVQTPGYDMVGPGSYILFDKDGGEFALDCLTGTFQETGGSEAIMFEWSGNDEMDEACGDGWAEIRPDGSLEGEISFKNGNDIPFIARRQNTSSTAC